MRALTWQGKRKVSVETVPDPKIEEPTDAVVRITASGLCGSDLHLYEVMGPFLDPGDVLGHEPMGVVEEVGPDVTHLRPGDRVVVPFNISCGRCPMCRSGLQSQCETTQNRDTGFGASLFGYTKLYGQVPGGQAEYLRVPQAHYGPIKVPDDVPDERYLYLSDVLPTAWQAVRYAGVTGGPSASSTGTTGTTGTTTGSAAASSWTPVVDSLVVLGLGPIGDMCTRIARHLGVSTVIGIDPVPERRARAQARGTTVIDPTSLDDSSDLVGAVRDLTAGRGADAVIDAVGMEAHGSAAKAAHTFVGFLPDAVAEKMMRTMGVDRLTALHSAVDLVRRGGTISLSGVYGGAADPMPMLYMFDRQLQLRMGQANVHRWVPEILPLLGDDDPLGVEGFATHHVPLDDAPAAYETFQKKQDGAVKIVFHS
ncbi:Threonine dehydrogenase [Quadrisphaera granulorum]|uniref:Threonine dehydrogenase-like Zn-dependent dehydrogenase n=1 Tax=Quadrisphaera granulorum TaxID=317664 RepID=A0A316ABN6_9ACTN|nr:alcohol dehydrogenase catalytic domain-containing protein [Quadrisphaera granulorum]PWJ54668.1 threonine dehydrogenase-like Zn-dependent dehydrogenase [Quadrisphaera granulorum]SZE96030.1 Threonine dehydrogenase [Quadrisphaera granulorum]